MTAPDFWKEADAAKTAERASALRQEVETWEKLESEVSEALTLAREAEAESASEFRPDLENKISIMEAKFRDLEFFTLFSGQYDERDAILAVHAGAGGTEAQDWAEMLLRMLLRYAERKGFRARVLDEHRGAEAGIKSATVSVTGRYAYGYLRSEHGVHRLVRISPFDAEKQRHTSFALVEVLPDLGDIEEIKIDPKDLRIDTFLSSGHGGQSVQTTYSAVRLVHLPTGITVSCQNERSQLQNRETAMKILKAKLWERKEEARQKEKQKIRGAFTSAEWGNQARSYVIHPYKLVKDHRTKYEMQDPQRVLDGDLDEFVESFLRWSKQEYDDKGTR